MLNQLLKLLNLFTKLVEVRDKAKKDYFDRYVQPTYDLAEEVYRDYSKLFGELEKKAKRARKTETIVRFLEERRTECLPIRMKLRAILRERSFHEPENTFESGVLRLMQCSVSTYDSESASLEHTTDARIQHMRAGHYLLDVINWITLSGEKEVTPIRSDLLNLISKIRWRLDGAWNTTVAGYAEFHSSTVPKIKPKR